MSVRFDALVAQRDDWLRLLFGMMLGLSGLLRPSDGVPCGYTRKCQRMDVTSVGSIGQIACCVLLLHCAVLFGIRLHMVCDDLSNAHM